MGPQQLFQGATTIVAARYAHANVSGHGTGFFFSENAEAYSHLQSEAGWRALRSTWLVTNRHVLLRRNHDGTEDPLTELSYRTRAIRGGSVEWVEHTLSAGQLADRARFHRDPRVDLAAVDLTPDMHEIATGEAQVIFSVATDHDLLMGDNPIHVETGSNVLVAGFPLGFHDETNRFPIVKAGIVASRWGADWNGQHRFLIDARLFPRSSGSLVTTSGEQVAFVAGEPRFSADPVVAILGVYQGAPNVEESEDGLDLGVVWYATLIPELISSGLPIAEAAITTRHDDS